MCVWRGGGGGGEKGKGVVRGKEQRVCKGCRKIKDNLNGKHISMQYNTMQCANLQTSPPSVQFNFTPCMYTTSIIHCHRLPR